MLKQRVATAAVAIPCVLAAMAWLPAAGLAVFFSLVLLMTAWEWGRLTLLNNYIKKSLYVFVIALLIFISWWFLKSILWVIGILCVSVAWWCVALVAVVCYPGGMLAHNVPLRGGPGMLIGGLILLPAFVALMHVRVQQEHGKLWLLLLFTLIWSADAGAYFAGRAFGRRKLAPAVSPGKTWAGALGGMILAMVVTLAGAAWLLGMRGPALWGVALLSLMTVAVSIVGDLLVSVFKRRAKRKDTGTLFPGHGGVLDRLDSLLAAAPVFALGLIVMGWQ